MIETDGDAQVVPNSPTIPYQEAFRTHLRVCERYDEMMLDAVELGDFWKDPDARIYQETLLELLPKMDLALKPEARAVRDAIRNAIAEDGSP